jgi:hypothetical protein
MLLRGIVGIGAGKSDGHDFLGPGVCADNQGSVPIIGVCSWTDISPSISRLNWCSRVEVCAAQHGAVAKHYDSVPFGADAVLHDCLNQIQAVRNNALRCFFGVALQVV